MLTRKGIALCVPDDEEARPGRSTARPHPQRCSARAEARTRRRCANTDRVQTGYRLSPAPRCCRRTEPKGTRMAGRTAAEISEQARDAAHTRWGRTTPEERQAHAAMMRNSPGFLDARVREIVDRAPELTPEQRQKLAA